MARRTRLVDCNPAWAAANNGTTIRYLQFDCPEGHADCRHSIPFSPALDGTPQTSPQHNGAQWDRTGDTFETITLTPSIRRIPQHVSRDAALAAGCIPEYITESLLCAFHGFIKNGEIEFCGDSK